MGEIGKNIIVFCYGDEIVVVDGGFVFFKVYQMGIDFIVLCIDYLFEYQDKIKGWILIYGYEDYIGGLFYIFVWLFCVLVYGLLLIFVLVCEKFSEFGFQDVDLCEVIYGDEVCFG